MTEQGKIFNTENVRSILENRKTMFRVPVKPQPPENSIGIYDSIDKYRGEGWFFQYAKKVSDSITMNKKHYLSNNGKSPFSKIGDRIYVRETFIRSPSPHNNTYYKASVSDDFFIGCSSWKSPAIMPKKYARIWLEIIDVRVERIRDMNRAAPFLEGCPSEVAGHDGDIQAAYLWFRDLWNSRYKNWSDNPWVWVCEFKVVNK